MQIEPSEQLTEDARNTLLQIARKSIQHGLNKRAALKVNSVDFGHELQVERASFVTLNRLGQLRGCIGHLEAYLPLVEDVAENAYAAAFRDPRFPPLAHHEYPDLAIHISVLTPASPLEFTSEADLLGKIRPGIDGLILVDGTAKGTFLPSVWEALPKAEDFLRQLKRKAGLAESHWSDSLKIYRYETESFPDHTN